jgi:hypothetical protein
VPDPIGAIMIEDAPIQQSAPTFITLKSASEAPLI